MRHSSRVWQIVHGLLLGPARWIIGLPPKRRPSAVRLWSSRIVTTIFVAWLFAFGPAGALAPRCFGYSVAEAGDVTVYYQNHVSPKLVSDVLTCARDARSTNLAFWGEPTGGMRPFTVFLCNSRNSYLQLALFPGGNACTIGSRIYVSPLAVPGPANLTALLTHEMSHAFLNQRLGFPREFAVPAWINEGIATHVAQNFWASDQSVRHALDQSPSPQLVPAAQMSSLLDWRVAMEAGPVAPTLAYGHARSLSADLVAHFGRDRILSYLDKVSLLQRPTTPFESAFGVTISQADEAWLVRAKSAGLVPSTTTFAPAGIRFSTAMAGSLPYAVGVFFLLWLVRQGFRIGRFARKVFRSGLALNQ